MKKRILSIVLAICLVLTLVPTTVFAEFTQKVYVIAGSAELCGITWNGDPTKSPGNVMTDNGDGTYTKVYTNVAVMDGYQFKVVENTLDGELTWHGLDNGNNVTFNVKSVCEVTITFDSAAHKIFVGGAGVELVSGLNIESIRTVGNGGRNWLNGIAWDPSADKNLMTEVSSGVYEITYTDIEAFDNYQFKFAANGSWNDSWGGTYAGSGVESDAVYNGENITVSVPYELADVTIRLDLTNFEFATKTGAKFTVTVTNKAKSDFTYTVSDDNKVTITGYTGTATAVGIPAAIEGKTVTTIGQSAFRNQTKITSVTIPDSVTSIGNRAFQNCKSLTSIVIPSGVTIIEKCTFEYCDNLSSVTIPDGVTTIGDSSFHLCKNLESINIPDSVLFIEDCAFQQCQKLTSINIPDGVSSIRCCVFSECTSLESVEIPSSVTSIGEDAFSGCTSLESVEIPGSVTSIENYAFLDCQNLESIFLPNGLDVTGADIPNTTSQVRYNLDETAGEVTITEIALGTDKTGVAIPATICGYPVVAVADSEQSKVGSHTCKGGTATCTAKAECSICGKDYGELDSSNHNLEKIPAKDATVTETGYKEYWHCKDCAKYFADEKGKNEIKLDDTVIAKLPPEIIEGKGQSITEGEVTELTFRSNASFSDFIRVELDGKTLDAENYTATEGSTIITLKADYVASLSAGEHTIGIVSDSGTATTTFTVNAKAIVNNDTKSPETGNDEYVLYLAMLLALCGAGIITTSVYRKRFKE